MWLVRKPKCITETFRVVTGYKRPRFLDFFFQNKFICRDADIYSLRKRICATTCYLNPSEKDCFLAKMSEISGFDAIIFRIFKYIAFR